MKQFIVVILMAIVTYIPRLLPIVVIKNRLNSTFLKSFLFYVPFAVLGAMTFPDILYSTRNILSATIGMMVALILAYLEKKLIIVAISAIFTVYICEIMI